MPTFNILHTVMIPDTRFAISSLSWRLEREMVSSAVKDECAASRAVVRFPINGATVSVVALPPVPSAPGSHGLSIASNEHSVCTY